MMPLARHPRTTAGPPTIRRFFSHDQASAALTARVVSDLETALQLRGRASLAVPGGTTPGEFLTMLGFRSLDWRRIAVTLTDERWVPPDHERSNQRLINTTLARHDRPFLWFPLWRAGVDTAAAASRVEYESGAIAWPLDVVVLGMGDDGHVASLFPGSEAGFDDAGGHRFVAVHGPGGEPRLSLSARAICQARHAYVLIKGARKESILKAAVDGDLPVARIMRERRGAIEIFGSD